MFSLISRWIRDFTFRTGRGAAFYRRFCRPDGAEWGGVSCSLGGFHSVGENVSINMGCNFTDPAYARIGDNVTLSTCTVLGHDGVIRVLNNRYGKKLDAVGMVDIRDNCFIGHGAIIMPRVTIGPDSIVAAGTVVTKNVPPGVVVGGSPARVICTTEELVARLESRCEAYPWIDVIRTREGAFDPALEPDLIKARVAYFFGDKPQ